MAALDYRTGRDFRSSVEKIRVSENFRAYAKCSIGMRHSPQYPVHMATVEVAFYHLTHK